MATRVPRTRAGGTWTESQYFSFIRGALRSAFRRYPVKQQVKVAARRKVKGKRWKYEYLCAGCGGWFKDKDVQVDHIEPAGTLRSVDDLPEFVRKLFCEEDNLQILCMKCHAEKTKQEREERKINGRR